MKDYDLLLEKMLLLRSQIWEAMDRSLLDSEKSIAKPCLCVKDYVNTIGSEKLRDSYFFLGSPFKNRVRRSQTG